MTKTKDTTKTKGTRTTDEAERDRANSEYDSKGNYTPTPVNPVQVQIVDTSELSADEQLQNFVNGLSDEAVLLEINRLTLNKEFGDIKRIGNGTDKEENRKYLQVLKKAELRK